MMTKHLRSAALLEHRPDRRMRGRQHGNSAESRDSGCSCRARRGTSATGAGAGANCRSPGSKPAYAPSCTGSTERESARFASTLRLERRADCTGSTRASARASKTGLP